MELIGMPLSPFVKKCELVLREKGIDFTYNQVSPLIDQSIYLKYNPLGKMPILIDDDFALPDSSAIAAYLDGLKPSPKLIADAPRDRAWIMWLEEFSDVTLLALCSGVFFCKYIGPRLLGKPVDEAGCQALLDTQMPPAFDYIEGLLADSGDYLWSGGYSLADISVSTQLCMFTLAGCDWDHARWPLLTKWYQRVRARPAFEDCLAEESAFFDIWLNTDKYLPKDGAAAARQLGR